MKWTLNDGGRLAGGFNGRKDCVCRSIAIASGRPYAEVFKALEHGLESQRKSRNAPKGGSPSTGVWTTRKWFKDYMLSLGFVWIPTMAIGTGCKVHLKDGELPMGKLFVQVSKHCTAVIDGVIHDTFDPQRDGKRCVYGYWKLA